jgi:flagellar motor switch protein FliN/FliY
MTDPNEPGGEPGHELTDEAVPDGLPGADITLPDLDGGVLAPPAPPVPALGHSTAAAPPFSGTTDLSLVLDVPVDLVVEIGRTRMTIRETLGICRGTIISLDRLAGEPADLLVNGRLVARGEVVAIDEEFGLRVTEVIAPEHRYETGSALATVGTEA